MKVFITGATGVLGHRLVERLADRGHDVHGLVRDADGAQLVEARGGTPRRGDVLERATIERAIDDDVEVVVHAATYFPVKAKPTEDDWQRNDRVRLEGARNVLDTVGSALDSFVFPSVVMVARQPDGSEFDETATRHPDRATQSAADVEALLESRAGQASWEPTVLRNGFFYAPDSGHTEFWGEKLLSGDLPVVGGGLLGRADAEMSLVHVDDSARAFAMAIDQDLTGLYHVVDEEPVTGADLFGAFADLLDAPEPSRIPGWLARFFVGSVNAKGFTSPFPTTNEKFRKATGWEPRFPTYREGLRQVVDTWENDGTLRETSDGYRWERRDPDPSAATGD